MRKGPEETKVKLVATVVVSIKTFVRTKVKKDTSTKKKKEV